MKNICITYHWRTRKRLAWICREMLREIQAGNLLLKKFSKFHLKVERNKKTVIELA